MAVSCKLYRMFYEPLISKDTKNCIDAFDTQRDVNRERRMFFQLFSAPGPAMYVNIMNYYYPHIQGLFGTDAYQNEDKNDVANIRGVVFDSPYLTSGNATQFGNGLKGNSTNIVTDTIFNWLGHVLYAYAVRTRRYNHRLEFFRNIPVSIPQLILFSKADRIAGYQIILDYIKQQRNAGTDVEYRMWEDSAHLSHYRQYPEEYVDLVSNFLEQCLAAEISDVSLSESEIFSVMESDISTMLS